MDIGTGPQPPRGNIREMLLYVLDANTSYIERAYHAHDPGVCTECRQCGRGWLMRLFRWLR